jgi:MFS family permease
MGWFRQHWRAVLTIIFTIAVAPVIGEFFIEVARDMGLYTHPVARLGAAMDTFFSVTNSVVFQIVALLLGGFLAGIWIDTLIRTWGERRMDWGTVLILAAIAIGAAGILLRVSGVGRAMTVTPVGTERQQPVQFTRIIGQTFRNTEVPLDNYYYDDCVFENVTFVWNGGPYYLNRARVGGSRQLKTYNPVIVSTVDFLKAFTWLESQFSESWTHIPPAPPPP